MAFALAKDTLPGYFNYTHPQKEPSQKFQLVRLGSLDKLEKSAFSELVKVSDIDEDYQDALIVDKVKTDLPLASDFGNINPAWLLFARSGLNKLQYRNTI